MEITMSKESRPDPQEYAKFYKEYLDKLNSAWVALATHGMDSVQFTEADARAGLAYKTLRAMPGHKSTH
jgi:hypothetical protein